MLACWLGAAEAPSSLRVSGKGDATGEMALPAPGHNMCKSRGPHNSAGVVVLTTTTEPLDTS